MARLTDKQKRFVEEYLVDLNATQAAIRAGYSEKTAEVIGYENLRKPQIATAIDHAMLVRQKRTEITQDMVLRELARVAFANGADFARIVSKDTSVTAVDEDGNLQETVRRVQSVELVDTDSVDPDKRAAIAGIKEGKYGIEVSSYDKVRALELLGKHLGLFDGKGNQKTAEENNLLEAIQNTEEIDTDDLPEVE